jgi:hypothetical protein
MTKKPKNVLKFKVPQKAVPANLPSAEWLKELQDTLKKQSEAAIALIKLTADAAQRIHRYTYHATLATDLFTGDELRTGWVDYATAIKLISDEPVRKRAQLNFDWLAKESAERLNEQVGEEEIRGMREQNYWGERYSAQDFYEQFIYEEASYPGGGAIKVDDVIHWRERYQELAKKSFDLIHRRFSREDRQKRGAKRQVAARGKRYKSKSAE